MTFRSELKLLTSNILHSLLSFSFSSPFPLLLFLVISSSHCVLRSFLGGRSLGEGRSEGGSSPLPSDSARNAFGALWQVFLFALFFIASSICRLVALSPSRPFSSSHFLIFTSSLPIFFASLRLCDSFFPLHYLLFTFIPVPSFIVR